MLTLSKRSIARDLSLALFLLVFLVEGVLFAYVAIRQSRFLRQQLERKSHEMITQLSETLAIPLWDFDDEQINKIGIHFVENQNVSALTVTDMRNRSLFSHTDPNAGGDRIVRSAPIVHGGQPIGQVQMALSLENFRKDLIRFVTVPVILLGVSLIVVLIATGMLLRLLLRRPLTLLQKGIDRMARGDYSYRFEEIQHSELTGIASGFKEMASVIQARETTLNQINQKLQAEIAERKAIESRIRESEARSRALLDAIPDLIVQFDRQGNILDYRGTRPQWPVTDADVTGKAIDDIAPPDIAALFLENITRALAENTIQFFEYALPMNGQIAHFECRIVAVTQAVALSIIRDITADRQHAVEKSRLEEQLRQAQKMEAVGTLAGGVAHDLNNILSGIVSYPELLLLDIADDSPLKKPLTIIRDSGEKAATIVQDLLTLARRGVTVTEIVNLNQVLDRYLSSPEYQRLRAYHPGIRLETRLDAHLLNMVGSPVHLLKTVMNLISNAAEAMPGGGTIAVSTRNQYVDLPIKGYDDVAEGDYVVLAVSDTGVGISDKDLKRIFDPFYTKKVMGRSGTGLGMAVVWGTVKDHRGYIDVYSKRGNGTTITLYMPATRRPLAQAAAAPAPADLTGHGEHVLVVDDIHEQREIATGMLKKLNYAAVAVASGEAAVTYVKSHAVDLVILDMIMDPGMDGLDTYRHILEHRPGQKAVIASGFSETDRVRAAQALGAGTYIKKPYTLDGIARAVKSELAR